MQATQQFVSVATPGTPVVLPTVHCVAFELHGVPGHTGKAYLGLSDLNRVSNVGVIKVFRAADTVDDVAESYRSPEHHGGNVISLADFAVDADVASEGLLLTYWTV